MSDPVTDEHCWCWCNTGIECCWCGDDSEGEGAHCPTPGASKCRHAPSAADVIGDRDAKALTAAGFSVVPTTVLDSLQAENAEMRNFIMAEAIGPSEVVAWLDARRAVMADRKGGE